MQRPPRHSNRLLAVTRNTIDGRECCLWDTSHTVKIISFLLAEPRRNGESLVGPTCRSSQRLVMAVISALSTDWSRLENFRFPPNSAGSRSQWEGRLRGQSEP